LTNKNATTTIKMVKNTKGGSSHKSQARKHTSTDVKQNVSRTRLATDEDEIYAQVVKLLGNGMCHVLCQDGMTRLCMIRGKFRFRGKRDNLVTNNKWILVGLRSYESEKTDSKKMQNCDLLEIYTDQDKERLKAQAPLVNWKPFICNDMTHTSGSASGSGGTSLDKMDEENLVFTDEREEEYKSIREKTMKEGVPIASKIDFTMNMEDGSENDEINIDDI